VKRERGSWSSGYIIVYEIDEANEELVILAVFHGRLNR
jgi:hypothetical protein